MNLVEPQSLLILTKAYEEMERVYKKLDEPMPVNKGNNRALDCAVIKYVHLTAKKDNMLEYNSVRCAFAEGKEAYPSSNFTTQLHIQICLRQSEFIKGYFLPRPIEKYNPYL